MTERIPIHTPLAPSRLAVVIAFAAIYLVWGSTYIAIQFAVFTLPPFLMAGTRFTVAGALMYAYARYRGDGPPSLANWHSALIVGGLLLLGGNGAVSWAVQRIPSGLAALLVATSPLWMVLMAWAAGGSRPTGRIVLGLVIGFAGLAVLVGPSDVFGDQPPNAFAAAAVLTGSLAWSLGSVIAGRLTLPESPYLATATEMIGGGVLLMLAGTVFGEWTRLDLTGVAWQSWAAYLYLIFIGSLVGFSAYVWLLRHVEVAKVSTYAYVNPVVAVLLGWLIAGEQVTGRILLAAAVIVTGVIFITSRRRAMPDKPLSEPALPAPTDPLAAEPLPTLARAPRDD
jgi:drug/metabolite transporter (DMT)-like permease